MNRSYGKNNSLSLSGWTFLLAGITTLLFSVGKTPADQPPDLPGEEITDKQYFEFKTSRDTIEKKIPQSAVSSPTWLDRAAQTWDAPSVSTQLSEDHKYIVQMGKGAIFIPYMSDPNLEPEVEILNEAGKIVASGNCGRKYSVTPGLYRVMLGSGSQKQKIVKPVQVSEGNVTTVIPTWCGLSIDVVDKDNIPFRGEYELARIDKFIPHGRGLGRDIDLGEKVKTWILSPGVYKIFGVGESYNTLKNFVTVRLLPGEYTRFVLVQNDENDMTITGGGTVQMSAGSKIASNWKYSIDVGGSIDFNATYDHEDTLENENSTSVSLIFRSNLLYKKDQIDWDSRFRLDEGVAFEDWDLNQLSSNSDELRLTSLFTWRILNWLGPYGRIEINTEIFPNYERWTEDVVSHYYVLLNESYVLADIDSINSSFRMKPPFSPFNFETGLGANLNAAKTRYFDARLLTGMGLKYKTIRSESERSDTGDVISHPTNDSLNNAYNSIITSNTNYMIIRGFNDESSVEIGPEAVLYTTLKLGRFGIVETEVKYFSPFNRMERPDLTLRSTVSWRLIRMITLDYEYQYTLKQPKEEALKQNESRHRVLIRFSLTSR